VREVLRVASYRFRATFGRIWRGLLAIVLLIGLTGGIAMAAVAGGRRTQSSFSTFLASTNPSDLSVSTYGVNGNSTSGAYSETMTKQIAHLRDVKQVETWIVLIAAPLSPKGAAMLNRITEVNAVGSVDGLYFNQDRVAVTKGRMADPNRPDEFVMTAEAAHLLGYHVGEVIPYGIFTTAQESMPGIGTPRVQPHRRINAKLVGLVTFNSEVVQDDVDRLPTLVLFTPALTREVLADAGRGAGGATYYALRLDHGSRDIAVVEKEFVGLLPKGAVSNFHLTAPVEAKADRAVKPVGIALDVFGFIAGLAALLLAAQAISRHLRAGSDELDVLRALGAGPRTTVADRLIGVMGAVVLGSLLAAGVAVALSPLSPLGPVRPVYPSRGFAVDWTVLGVGLAVLIVGLGATAVVLAYAGAPHRVARRSRLARPHHSTMLRAVASTALPAPAVVGVRFALEPGGKRTTVPLRSALVGATLAVVIVVATLTFGSGLQSLVSHPALYGWNWTYMLNPSNDVPPQALALLAHDPAVAAWTGVNDTNVDIDGQSIPVFFGDTHPALTPPILSGHAIARKDQIVIGAATLAQLHKRVGDTVVVTLGSPRDAPFDIPPTRLAIVGTATMPAAGYPSIIADHTSMGTGALLSNDVLPAAFQRAQTNPQPILNGPGLVFVRMRPDVSRAAGLADMRRITRAADRAFAAVPNGGGEQNTVSVLGVQHPAEIVNYRTMGATPALLASGVAAGAIVALGLTLAASVRQRRRDLALLKTFGFTRRQLGATVAWQASVAALIGIIVGIPLGIALGRQLWIEFARDIDAVPHPTVPAIATLLVAVGALVLANVVAAGPGLQAARTRTALLLHAE
jgi:hypothetical protein